MNEENSQGGARARRRRRHPQRGKLQSDGVLEGHFKSGNTYRPPFLAIEQFHMADWIRDDLPDMFWPAALIALDGDQGGIRFGQMQQEVNKIRDNTHGLRMDGRLTSLQDVPESGRAALLPLLTEKIISAAAMPDLLLAGLRLYSDLPGRWLLVDGFDHRDIEHSSDEALNFMSDVVRLLAIDREREALLKFVPLAWSMVTGAFRSDQTIADVLEGYPGNADLRVLADTTIRASFGASKAAENTWRPELKTHRHRWATSFWRQNWKLAPCEPLELLDASESVTPDDTALQIPGTDEQILTVSEDLNNSDTSSDELSRRLVAATTAHVNRYLEQALSPDLDIDLFNPSRHEVTSALITRTARSVISVLLAPHQWSGEHSAWLIRQMAETEIILIWLDAQPDSTAYEKYKAYGRGKEKLMRRQMSNLADQFPEGPPEDLKRTLLHMTRKLQGDRGEDFIEVNTDSNFSGKSTRLMAEEVDLAEFYRHVFQSSSGVVHNEWQTLEDSVMQRCLNPLHRFHQIPSMELDFTKDARLAEYFADKFAKLVELTLEQLQQRATRASDDDPEGQQASSSERMTDRDTPDEI